MYLRIVQLGRRTQAVSARDVITLLNVADVHILQTIEHLPTTPAERRSRTMLLGAHLFSHIALRKWPRNGPVAQVLLCRLKDGLERDVWLASTWSTHLPWLLWALVVGAVSGAHDSTMRSWFCSKGYFVVGRLGLRSVHALEIVLNDIIWDETFDNGFLRKWFSDCLHTSSPSTIDLG